MVASHPALLLLLQLLQLVVVAPDALAGPISGSNSKKVLEQEVAILRENLTTVWETLSLVRHQLEKLESEERVHHHHHHYHHFYHNDSSYPDDLDNLTDHRHEVLVSHERTREMKHLRINYDGSNHDPSTGEHRHYHHFVHHHHAKTDENGETYVDERPLNAEHKNHPRQCLLTNGKNGKNGKNGHKHNNHDGMELCQEDDEEEVLAEAECHVKPNRALPVNERQNVRGTVTFRQKQASLEILLSLRGFITTPKHAHHGHQSPHDLHVHGLHVHEFGDLSNGCESAGGHYNPLSEVHGGPDSSRRHIGDLGNVKCDDEGKLELKITDTTASLTGAHSVIGKTLVIHENADDFGADTENEESLVNGNAGRRLACCVITKID